MKLLCAMLVPVLALGGVSAQEPVESGVTEKATVRLVVLDVVVVDREDNTVPDLTIDDFEILASGVPIPVDTLDVDCPGGRMAEPRAVARAAGREAPPEAASGGKIVLAFDYLHMSGREREAALEQAEELVRGGGTGDDEVMVAALTGGLRVEQEFSADQEAVLNSLRRMRYDVSLWNGRFDHINEYGFIEGMGALLEVAGAATGHKAVVLFSSMTDVPLDLQFKQLAGVAAASRCSIYPVDPGGLRPKRMAAVTAAPMEELPDLNPG